MALHPIQPLEIDAHGTLRFKENKIVRFLLDEYKPGLNHLCQIATSEDYCQLIQLIGYSHNGTTNMGSMSDEVWLTSQKMHESGKSELESRNEVLREQLESIKKAAEEAINVLNNVTNTF